jgi:beta-lactamase regulating signal transducer with metallopeptidase domain
MLIWCAETTIVTGVLALVALAIGRHRSVSPAVRHALWLVVLIKFVTPPLVSWPWALDVRSAAWPAGWRSASAPAVVAETFSPATAPDSRSIEISPPGGCAGIDAAPERPDDSPSAIQLAAAGPDQIKDIANEVPAAQRMGDTPAVARELPATSWWQSLPGVASLMPVMLLAWLVSSIAIAFGQAIRIVRFRRCLRGALAAPDFLIDEADRIGHWLGVTTPELLMVDDLGTPMLWCLGRPQLLLPTRLVQTLPVERWRGILTHELAHLRRRDHWVSRLELATGLIWWWNPVYWLTRVRLDAEAELACDAWVVWALPKDRLSYAEVLFDICSTMSPAKPMAPTLSVVGSGRFFERRLTMILHDRVPCRLSPLGLAAACLLLLVALPSWSAAQLADFKQEGEALLAFSGTLTGPSPASWADDDDKDNKAATRAADDEDDDDDADDDDDDDDQDAAALARAKARAEAARARVEAIERRLEAAQKRNEKKAKDKDEEKRNKRKSPDSEGGLDFSQLEKELESTLGEGSEFAKQLEKLGETIGKQMEKQFGSGSEFEKQMTKLGKELESKFGEGSEFVEKMKDFGKEMESRFGPGSEFEQKMKKLGEEMQEKHRANSELAKKLQEKAASSAQPGAKARAEVKDRGRQRQIERLEAQVAELMEQIKSLKSQKDE